ncbi:MAG: response regulator transcription factor [Chloroflexales bacterium]
MAHVLFVEDEENLRVAVGYTLRKDGHTVSFATSGPEAITSFPQLAPDLVLLDVMLPGCDGLAVLRAIRLTSSVPVIMLTARADEVDTVVGLELGADDYIAKPFRMRELQARVSAALRRASLGTLAGAEPRAAPLELGDLRLDPSTHQVTRAGHPLRLKPRAFALLSFLMQHRSQVFSREQLLHQLWGDPFIGDPRTVDVHIRWIREQIEDDPGQPRRLRTIRGVGYQLVE